MCILVPVTIDAQFLESWMVSRWLLLGRLLLLLGRLLLLRRLFMKTQQKGGEAAGQRMI